jgi:hypothetical protein
LPYSWRRTCAKNAHGFAGHAPRNQRC